MVKRFEGFDGHIILLCKNHYNIKDVKLIDALRRVWCVRCGLDVEHANGQLDQYIANRLCDIIDTINPNRVREILRNIHSELHPVFSYRYEGMTPLEILISMYRSEIAFTKVKENEEFLIELPEPLPELFDKIIRGEGEFNDYQLVENQMEKC